MTPKVHHYSSARKRLLASFIDHLLVAMISSPLLSMAFGEDIPSLLDGEPLHLVILVLPMLALLVFMLARSATPGKLLLKMRIVDSFTGGRPSARQILYRDIGFLFSSIPLFLGVAWLIFDRKRQTWHDKLAQTVVVDQA